MSIINDALKKTQESRKEEKDKRTQANTKPPAAERPDPTPTLKPQPVQKRNNRIKRSDVLFTWKIASLLTVTALLVIMALANYQRITQENTTSVQAVMKPLKKVKVAFEGVLLSDDVRVALINKQSLHLGDKVNGMKIIAIRPDTVDLQSDNGIIQLRAGSTYLL